MRGVPGHGRPRARRGRVRGVPPIPYFLVFLKIFRGNFFLLWPRSTSSPVRLLSSSPGLFLAASCGMRVFLVPLGRQSEMGEGVSGSVELGLCDRDESEWLGLPAAVGWLISPRLEDFSMPWFAIIIFFITMGLSGSRSCKAARAGGSPWRPPPLGVGTAGPGPAASSTERVSSVGRAASSLGAELGMRCCSLRCGMEESESQRVKSLRWRDTEGSARG